MSFFEWNEIQIFTFFHVLLRVSSLIFFLPIYGDKAVSPVIKILFGAALSFVIYPVVWAKGLRVDQSVIDSQSKILWSIFGEITFGVMLGFIARWIFDAVSFAGHFAGQTMGFSMGSIIDPHTETQTVAIAELYYIIAVLLFLSFNGHLIYLQAILDSFKIVPIAADKLFTASPDLINYLILMSSEVLILGLKLCAPVIVVILIVNLTVGILARAVPQMNALVISFSANILIGTVVVLITMPAFNSMLMTAFDGYKGEIYNFMTLFGK